MTTQMRGVLISYVVLVLASLWPVFAQTPPRPPQSLASYLQGQYATLKRNLVGSVDKMPAEHFVFKPVPEVMSYGELLAHVVGTQYYLCSTVKGGADPGATANFKALGQAAVGLLVKDAFAYCDELFASLTDQTALEMVILNAGANQRQTARASQLTQVIVHGNEHYGNLVTYMRMKGVVPPSSSPTPQR